jgi:hypothetical protein
MGLLWSFSEVESWRRLVPATPATLITESLYSGLESYLAFVVSLREELLLMEHGLLTTRGRSSWISR